jgi:uncharacterized protein YndB with AHSA1/START domain
VLVFHMRLLFRLLASGVLVGVCSAVWAAEQSDPYQKFDSVRGIDLYRFDTPGEEMPGFRGEVVIDRPLEDVLQVLRDVEHHTEWMHRCAVSEILRTISDDRAIVYNRTDVPWPVADRDVVLDTRFETASEGRLVVLTVENTDPNLSPPPPRVVRMPKLSGFYRLWKMDASTTKVVYQVEADIGGRVPKWIAERVARDMPYETLSRLRARVRQQQP